MVVRIKYFLVKIHSCSFRITQVSAVQTVRYVGLPVFSKSKMNELSWNFFLELKQSQYVILSLIHPYRKASLGGAHGHDHLSVFEEH